MTGDSPEMSLLKIRYKEANVKVTYSIVDSYHNLCLDKKDIIYAEIEASDPLLKDVSHEEDKKAIELEITELKMTLDLMT
jgi:hypothetical protein